MNERQHPAARPHGELRELFEDVFFVTGAFRMSSGPPLAFSRNMVVIRHEQSLTLVNAVRLGEEGLARLAELGIVENVIRLAAFHGSDDPFYKERYGARVFALHGQVYAGGFDIDVSPEQRYFSPDVEIDQDSSLPVPGATLVRVQSAHPPEGLLLLERGGGILISGDSLQNWGKTDRYFNLFGKLMMRFMGFIKPHNVGPGWFKLVKPDPAELKRLLELPFDHVLPAHGAPVIGNAKAAYRNAIARLQEPVETGE